MPAYKTPKKFPGVDKLPALAQVLMERMFPADEMPVPAMTTVAGPIEALKPLKGSLDYVQGLIKSETAGPSKYMPRRIREFWKLFDKPLEDVDHLKVLAQEKINVRPPAAPAIDVPEGFSGPTGMKRDPLVEEMTKRFKEFNDSNPQRMWKGSPIREKPLKPYSSDMTTPPPLSGRWANSKGARGQQSTLKSELTKKR